MTATRTSTKKGKRRSNPTGPGEMLEQRAKAGGRSASVLPAAGLATRARQSHFAIAAVFVVTIAALFGGLAAVWASRQDQRFSATAVVQLEPSEEIEDTRELVEIIGSIDRGGIVVTLAGVAESGSVTSAARSQLGLTPEQTEDYEVEALQVLTSHLVDITVTGPSKPQTIELSDAIADQLRASFRESHPVYQVTTVTPANVPDSSGRPSPVLIVVAAMLAAAVGAMMLWLALFGGSDERTDLPLPRRST